MATNEVKIKITAQDQASGPISKLTNTLDKVSQSVLGINLTDLVNPATLAAGAIGLLVDQTKKAISETLDYNKAVRELSDNLGITTVETSMLIQTADDFTVSQNDLTSALQMALKNGFAPSIETIAQMADEYLTIADPTERAAKLTEVFGRNWSKLVPMLKEGGDAIRAAAAAQDEALLVTEEAAQATRDYEIAMDKWGDSVTVLKNKVGNALIPALTSVVDWATQGKSAMVQLSEAYKSNLIPMGEMQDISSALAAGSMTEAEAIAALNAAIANYDTKLRETDKIEEIRLGRLVETKTATDDVATATVGATDIMNDYTSQLLFNLAASKLDAEGAMALAYSMGLVDDNTVAAYDSVARLTEIYDTNNDGIVSGTENVDAYVASLAALDRRIRDLPDKTSIDIYVNTYGSVPSIPTVGGGGTAGPGTGSGKAVADAIGGPMYPGETHIVGEMGYPETVVVGAGGGYVYPTSPTTNNNYNLTINSAARSEQVSASFALMRAMAR